MTDMGGFDVLRLQKAEQDYAEMVKARDAMKEKFERACIIVEAMGKYIESLKAKPNE